MSDKSFGDHTNRNILKNPLLSSAVTGLSIEDLTHNAVLLPVAQTQEVFGRQDQQLGHQNHTLAHTPQSVTNHPSGDANSNITLTNLPPPSNSLDRKQNEKQNTNVPTMPTVSKASLKSEDDFDVNEYFARLQGSRYVSAPLNSLLKEDNNANLEATEENLEEINLNDPEKVQNVDIQQSLTADIAQNFSQLPTVLPQVASAVFSSFSNMLTMKSREQTPDESKLSGYQAAQFQRPEAAGVPLMVEEQVREVAPPPKEPPLTGTSNFRITTKKKAYAQIPGLSYGDNLQNLPVNPPMSQSIPSIFTPTSFTNPQTEDPKADNIEVQKADADRSLPKEINLFKPVQSEPNKEVEFHSTVKYNEPNLYSDKVDVNRDPTVQFYSADSQAAAFTQPAPPIIPPPPMFSNSSRKDNQVVGKSVLPPSVARRISANHPIIKPQAPQTSGLTPNIFVPHMDSPNTDNSQNLSNLQTCESQIKSSPSITQMFIPTSATTVDNTSIASSATELSTPIAPTSSKVEVFAVSSVALNNPQSAVSGVQSMTSNMPPPQLNVATAIQESSFFNPPNITNKMLPLPGECELTSKSKTELQQPPSKAISMLHPASISSQTSSLPPLPTNVLNPISIEKDSQPSFSSTSISYSAPPTNIPVNYFDPSTNIPVLPPTNIFQVSSPNNQSILENNPIKENPNNVRTQLPPPPSFFDPNTTVHASVAAIDQRTIKQFNEPPVPEPPKVAEPPKVTGNQNYRLPKKRPQYYAGPIEGIGSISNNFKPIIPSVESNTFHGALFTPSQEPIAPIEQELVTPTPNIEHATVPFDINKTSSTTYTQFDLSNPQENIPMNMQPDYNTAFDFSRTTTERYEEPKQESKGFGIIGSLKSKLSSIDIIKIQNTVTTFFDPAYNDTKTDGASNDNKPYGYQSNPPISHEYRNQEFGVFVPSEPQMPPESGYQNYQNQYNYDHNAQYYQGQHSNNYYQAHDQTYNYYTDMSQNSAASYNVDTSSTTVNTTETSQVDKPNKEITSWSNISSAENIITCIPSSVELQPNPYYTAAPLEISTQYVAQNDNNWPTQTFFGLQPAANTTDVSKNEERSNLPTQHLFQYQSPIVDETNKTIETIKKYSVPNTIHTEKEDLQSQNILSYEKSLIKNENKDIDISNKETENQLAYNNQKVLERNNILTETKEALLSSVKNHIQMPENTFSNNNFGNRNKDLFQIQDNQRSNQENISKSDRSKVSQIFNLSEEPSDIKKLENDVNNISLNKETSLVHDTSVSFDENASITESKLFDDNQEVGSISDFNICETCREVNKPEERETEDLTSQLIENIIAPIQLLNPVEVPLTESNTPVDDRIDFDSQQCVEISNITEETIETLQVQSVAKFLDESVENAPTGYGWSIDNTIGTSKDFVDQTYTFQIDPSTIGFYGGNSLFFDNIPNNASDEIKAEFKNSYDDSPVILPRQMSIPSAPPAPDDDSKSDDNGGLDVHSIEQDAKKDFPFLEEFVIDPSETDDDKIEYKERERTSEDPVPDVDTFTNRVERFKKMEETATEGNEDVFDAQVTQKDDLTTANSPAITIASYFDTGNYAAETHYKNSISSPYTQFQVCLPNVVMRIPPGFEDEYKRKLSGISSEDLGENKSEPHISDTNTAKIPPSNTHTFKSDVELPKTDLEELRKSPILPPLASLVSDNMFQTQIEPFPKVEDKEFFTLDKLPSFATAFGANNKGLDVLKKEESTPLSGIHSATTEVAGGLQTSSESENAALLNINPLTTALLEKLQVISEPKKENTPLYGISSTTTARLFSEPEKEVNIPGISSMKTELPEKSPIFSEPNKEENTTLFGSNLLTTELSIKSQIFTERKKEESAPLFVAKTEIPENSQTLTELKKEIAPLSDINPDFSEKSQLFASPKKEEGISFFGMNPIKTTVPEKSQIISEPKKEENTSFVGVNTATTEVSGTSQIFDEPKKEDSAQLFGINPIVSELPGKSNIFSEPKKEHTTYFGINPATTELTGKSPIFSELKEEHNISFLGINPALTEVFRKPQLLSEPKKEENTPFFSSSSSTTKSLQTSEEKPFTQTLPDPISFFSAAEKSTNEKEESDNNFNRLASYFTTPTKADPTKPFFELSQSQNHYRHASTEDNLHRLEKHIDNIPLDRSVVNYDLIKDLTSIQNLENDQIVRTVNYFTIEYDNVNLNIMKLNEPSYSQILDKDIKVSDYATDINIDENILEDPIIEDNFNSTVRNCKYCCNNARPLLDRHYKVRKTMDDDNTESRRDTTNTNMETVQVDTSRKDVKVNFGDGNEESSNGVDILAEQRPIAEYTPVKHHWYYRVDLDSKSLWRGFSVADSKALEEAFHSANLDENTVVATDGGRYDVNIIGRLRVAVYWADKPTNVRRCSWFYKGTTDPRYVPYTEAIAEKLEHEYRHGITTGEWHRRLLLPNNELVVMHGPSVIVHLQSPDEFSSAPLFNLNKRVYRNPIKVRVSEDEPKKVDHLVMLVHGAGEYRIRKEIQTTIRPRVVRRGIDEAEIEDAEPSNIDHLLLLCHGVGSACDMRLRPVEKVVDDFRTTSHQLLQSHYRNSYDNGAVSRIEVLPISWHSTLHSGEAGVDRRLAQITLDSIPKLRSFTNDTVLDVLFYTSPVFCQTIQDTVCAEINRLYSLFHSRNPGFKGGVSLGGHSLGSVILYDLLCHQTPPTEDSPEKRYVSGTAGTGQATVRYPHLEFSPSALYALGSPIAMFECIRGVESLGREFSLPTCKNFFNIFHPYDPIAYRIEPLINLQLRDVKPYLIPHHKGRKRMHLELKDTMARVGADLKQKLIESLKSTWSNMWRTQAPTDGALEKVVEEEMEKEQLCVENKEDVLQDDVATPDCMGKLNDGRRIDYVLQEAPIEMINEYLFAMSSHLCYWESEDTMLLILREVYSSIGVEPDCTVPPPSMSVQRTRPAKQEETTIVSNATEHPSTSRGES